MTENVGETLQPVLIELIDLALVGKQMHWNVVGPNFRSVHLMLDEFIDDWRDLYDTVAERIVQIGNSPNGQAAEIAKYTIFTALPVGSIKDSDVINKLTARLTTASQHARLAIEALGKDDDLVSQEILIEVSKTLDKQLWFTRVQL